CFLRNLTLPVRHCERPAYARSASYGGFESAEARSAESEGGSEAISLHLRMTSGGDCFVARKSGWLARLAHEYCRSRINPGTVRVGGAVRNDVEGGADRALREADLAAMGAHQLGRAREADAGAAASRRALERLEQVRARVPAPGPCATPESRLF